MNICNNELRINLNYYSWWSFNSLNRTYSKKWFKENLKSHWRDFSWHEVFHLTSESPVFNVINWNYCWLTSLWRLYSKSRAPLLCNERHTCSSSHGERRWLQNATNPASTPPSANTADSWVICSSPLQTLHQLIGLEWLAAHRLHHFTILMATLIIDYKWFSLIHLSKCYRLRTKVGPGAVA